MTNVGGYAVMKAGHDGEKKWNGFDILKNRSSKKGMALRMPIVSLCLFVSSSALGIHPNGQTT